MGCERKQEVLESMIDEIRGVSYMPWRETLRYPQNYLRNVGRKTCDPKATVVTDVDMVPSKGGCKQHFLVLGKQLALVDMDLQLEKFFESNKIALTCSKCIFVIPIYELDRETVTKLPRSKSDLMRLVRQGKSRAFHSVLYKINQGETNLTR